MADAAHVGSFDSEVYQKPFTIAPKTVLWPRRKNYLNYEGGDKLPEQMEVWLVQETSDGSMGVVSSSAGFEDYADGEVIALGYNTGKYYGAVGIGRDRSVLQWGYQGGPSVMTADGQKLFVNCVTYISKFGGKVPGE